VTSCGPLPRTKKLPYSHTYWHIACRAQGRFIIGAMNSATDLAQIRFDNALSLFDEFVQNTIKHPDAATLRGLEGRFAERVQIQPSYWSQIKGRSRQIGERLARQFEQLCHKPNGWMDQAHTPGVAVSKPAVVTESTTDSHAARDDDERFIVGLVLTYYRRHPQRARTRLLDLLGEVLTPSAPTAPSKEKASVPKPAPTVAEANALWLRSQVGVAPLRQKK